MEETFCAAFLNGEEEEDLEEEEGEVDRRACLCGGRRRKLPRPSGGGWLQSRPSLPSLSLVSLERSPEWTNRWKIIIYARMLCARRL